MGNNNSSMICPSVIAGRHRRSKTRGFTNKIKLFSSPKDSTHQSNKKKPLVITSEDAEAPISSPKSQLTNDDARGLNRGRSLDLMSKEDVSDAPPFTVEQRALVKHSWHSVEEHIAEVRKRPTWSTWFLVKRIIKVGNFITNLLAFKRKNNVNLWFQI